MEIAQLIVTVIGFIILGWYQRYYINALKGQVKTQSGILDSQNKAIENLKMHVEIFQSDKINEFVKMRETTFEDKKNKEIDKIKTELEEKFKKNSDAFKLVLNEYGFAMEIVSALVYYVEPDPRQSILLRMPESKTKAYLSKTIDETPYYREDFFNAFTDLPAGKGLLSGLVASDAANKAAPVNSSEKPDCIK